MEHLARFVVRRRRLVLLIAVLLLIPSLLGAVASVARSPSTDSL